MYTHIYLRVHKKARNPWKYPLILLNNPPAHAKYASIEKHMDIDTPHKKKHI